jgi:hypothetical protein
MTVFINVMFAGKTYFAELRSRITISSILGEFVDEINGNNVDGIVITELCQWFLIRTLALQQMSILGDVP